MVVASSKQGEPITADDLVSLIISIQKLELNILNEYMNTFAH